MPREERTLIHHLGLPFYYRHRPYPAMGRAAFWLGSLFLIGLFFFNAVLMPSEPGSILHAIRTSPLFFSGVSGYRTFEQGMRGLFHQSFVFALILSGVIAPLFSTFSLASERVSGTMEFLRLTPMSTPAIVLGKLFAPAYPLHVLSGVLLLLGVICGWAGGLPLGKIALVLLALVLGCITLHALGGLLAAFSTIFRGFGPVLGLLVFGYLFSMLPMAAVYAPGYAFLAYLSPWGALDGAFWHSFANSRYYRSAPQFLGSESMLPFYLLAAHVLLSMLFVWATCRRLDRPEKPALPRGAWPALWLFGLCTAFGITRNNPGIQWNAVVTPADIRSLQWVMAALAMGWVAAAVCLLALLDHPFRRDAVLAALCEAHAGREKEQAARGSFKKMGHGLFVTGLALISAAAITFFYYKYYQSAPLSIAPFPFPWPWLLGLAVALMALFFLASMILETASMRFRSLAGRLLAGSLALGLLLVVFLAPLIHVQQAMHNWRWSLTVKIAALKYRSRKAPAPAPKMLSWNDWYRVGNELGVPGCKKVLAKVYAGLSPKDRKGVNKFKYPGNLPYTFTSVAQQFPAKVYQALPPKMKQRAISIYRQTYGIQYASARQQEDMMRQKCPYDAYTRGIQTPRDMDDRRAAYSNRPLNFFWHYHRRAFVSYPGLFLFVVAALIAWRRWTYRALRREAGRAMAEAASPSSGSPADSRPDRPALPADAASPTPGSGMEVKRETASSAGSGAGEQPPPA